MQKVDRVGPALDFEFGLSWFGRSFRLPSLWNLLSCDAGGGLGSVFSVESEVGLECMYEFLSAEVRFCT